MECTKNGLESPDNRLADPEVLERSKGKKNEDYYDPEAAEEFLKAMDEYEEVPPEAVTAAGEPQEEEGDDPVLSPLYFTVDESGAVLELVKADDEGLFIRIEGEWVDISDEEEFPTVYEQDMHFANDESVSHWDSELEENDNLKLEDISDYLL